MITEITGIFEYYLTVVLTVKSPERKKKKKKRKKQQLTSTSYSGNCLCLQPSKVTTRLVFYRSFLKSISSLYTWQVPSKSCTEQIILSQASLTSHCFKAKLLNPFSVALQPLLHWWFTIISFPSSGPILSRVSSSSCVGVEMVIFSQAVTWCLTAVGYWYNMLKIHSFQPGTNDKHPVDLRINRVTSALWFRQIFHFYYTLVL